jgi:hypothetical protein
MKKLMIILLAVVALSGCRQYCFNCRDEGGARAGQKCFESEEDQNVWIEAQRAANPRDPISCE